MDSKLNNESWMLLPWVIFLATPFVTPNIFQAPTAIGLMAFTAALFAAAWMQVSTNNKSRISIYGWLFLLLCLLPTTALLIQGHVNSPWLLWRQTLFLTAAWLIYAMSSSRSASLMQSEQWTAIIAITVHLYIIYALIQTFNLRFFVFNPDALFPFWSNRIANFPGPLMQRNFQSLFIVISIALLWMQMIKSHRTKLWGIATILPLSGLFLTSSRSGILVLSIAIIAVLLFSKNKRHDAFSMLWPAMLAWLIYTFIMASPTPLTSGTGEGIVQRIENSGVLPRILIWDMSLNIFTSHPWFGVGWGNLPAHGMEGIAMSLSEHPFLEGIASTLPFGHVWAHNIILQFLSEGGIFGGASILLLLIALGRQAWKYLIMQTQACDGQVYGCLISIIIIIHGMVSISLMQPFFMCLLALSLSACFSPVHKKIEP